MRLQHVDGLLAALELRVVADRPVEPAPQQAAAHRRRAAVHEARERVFVAPTQARLDLEVAARLRVEDHGCSRRSRVSVRKCGSARALRVLRVLEQAARGADAGRRVLGVEAREVERAELLAEQALAGAGIEVPRRPAARARKAREPRRRIEILGEQQLGGLQALDLGVQRVEVGELGDAEAAAREIEPGRARSAA